MATRTKAVPATQGVQHAYVTLNVLAPHPRNYRTHPEAQVKRLAASLARFGQVRSIVAQALPDGYRIVAGHGVVDAARTLGWTDLAADIIPADWTDAQVAGYLVADNETVRGAEDDLAALVALLEAQQEAGYALDALGYDADALAALLAESGRDAGRAVDDPGGGGDDFDTTPESGPTRCQPGDLWQLGAHRLLCGDSTKREDVARLMDGEMAQATWTDPPYGVNHAGGSKDPRSASYRSGDTLSNDNLSEVGTERLVEQAMCQAAANSVPGGTAYIACPPGTLLPHFIAAMASGGFIFHHSLAWVKDTFVFGRCDYHYRHETILYGWLNNGAHYWAGDRTLGSVFEVPRPKRSEEHPTMKPVALIVQMVANSSRTGDVVYDPFLGSGSTLIAAERLGRRCYGMEIDPRYCDVILRRWEAETGGTAVRLEGEAG